MKIDEWCQLHDITKASYYWRLRKVREAYLKTADHTQTFVEVPSFAVQPVNMAAEYNMVRDCQNRPQGMKIDEWCQLHDITKASYYWRLRKVREAYLKTADHTQTFVEVPSFAVQPVNMAAEYI